MIDALNTATTGLLRAEKRATELAADILQTASSSVAHAQDKSTSEAQPKKQAALNSDSSPELVSQIVELKANQRQFEANAAVFTRLDETQDFLMGTLFDEKS